MLQFVGTVFLPKHFLMTEIYTSALEEIGTFWVNSRRFLEMVLQTELTELELKAAPGQAQDNQTDEMGFRLVR